MQAGGEKCCGKMVPPSGPEGPREDHAVTAMREISDATMPRGGRTNDAMDASCRIELRQADASRREMLRKKAAYQTTPDRRDDQAEVVKCETREGSMPSR